MAKTIRVVAAIISSDGRYLITQRRETAVLPLLWEFPGGRVELGERDEEALRRELRERLDANIEVIEKVGERRHVYEGYTVELVLYAAKLMSEKIAARRVKDFRWIASSEFAQYSFPDADQGTMDLLLGEKR